jgi:hypothetical protein
MELVYTYDASQNPDNASLPGVPLRDLTADDIANVPAWLQSSIAAQPFYLPVKAKKQSPQVSDNA